MIFSLIFCPGDAKRFVDSVASSNALVPSTTVEGTLNGDWKLLEPFFPGEIMKCQNGHISPLNSPGNRDLTWSWE